MDPAKRSQSSKAAKSKALEALAASRKGSKRVDQLSVSLNADCASHSAAQQRVLVVQHDTEQPRLAIRWADLVVL